MTSLRGSAINFVSKVELRRQVNLTYRPGDSRTSFFEIAVERTDDSDGIQLYTTIHTDYSNVAGLAFRWARGSAGAKAYERSARLLMAFLVASILFNFAFYIEFDTEPFTQVFLIVVGAAGVIAANPIGYFCQRSITTMICDHVLMAAFVAVFRMFTLLQIELVRTNANTPTNVITAVVVVLCALYSRADAIASYGRRVHVLQACVEASLVLDAEMVRAVADLVFEWNNNGLWMRNNRFKCLDAIRQ
jgi:hypothetical protein